MNMNMNTYKFVQGNHGNQMYSAFAELWKDRKYCDCTLVVENFRIQVKKDIQCEMSFLNK